MFSHAFSCPFVCLIFVVTGQTPKQFKTSDPCHFYSIISKLGSKLPQARPYRLTCTVSLNGESVITTGTSYLVCLLVISLNHSKLKCGNLTDRQGLGQLFHNIELQHGPATEMFLRIRKVVGRQTFDSDGLRELLM